MRDAQGVTGKKVEIYSLPYSAINMWSSENAGTFDWNAEIELWTRAGRIKVNLGKGADVRRLDSLIAWAVLGSRRQRRRCSPLLSPQWYLDTMSTTFQAPLGDRGRLVIPAELRARQGWEQGMPLLFIETPRGVVLMTREQAKLSLREQLAGTSLVDELVAERRAAARREDVE